MTEMPTLTGAAEALYERMEPYTTYEAENGYPYAILCAGLGAILEEAYDLAELGWDDVMDPAEAPAFFLSHLMMWAGRAQRYGLTEAQMRDQIGQPFGLRRGTPAAMIAAAQETLTGTQYVGLVEKSGGDAYQLLAVTRTSETPDAAATEAALRSQKPVGIVLTYIVVAGWTIGEFEVAYAALTIGDLEASTFTDIADMEANTP